MIDAENIALELLRYGIRNSDKCNLPTKIVDKTYGKSFLNDY